MNIQNIPETFHALQTWSKDYERQTMKPTEASHQLAETTISLVLYHVPNFLKSIAKRLVIGLMDNQLRTAMILPSQPRWVRRTINGFFTVRRVLLRNALPRLKPFLWINDESNESGQYNVNWAYVDVYPVFQNFADNCLGTCRRCR